MRKKEKQRTAKGWKMLAVAVGCVMMGTVASITVYAEEPNEAEYAVTEIVTATTTEVYENYKYTISSGKITIVGLDNPSISSDINLVIPATINGYPVTSIASGAFQGNVNIKSVAFNEGLTYIGYSAFMDCTNLTGNIVLPSTLTKIDGYYSNKKGAFQNTSITSVEIADGNEALEIASHTFFNCSALKSVVLPGRLSYIGSYAFHSCANLDSLTMAEGTIKKTVDEYAFSGISITKINIPSTITTIGTGAFYDCKSLVSITLNEGLQTIGYSAFQDCINLTGKITIPSTVTELCANYSQEKGAFQNTAITEVEFKGGNAALKIGSHSFYNCRSLTKVSLPGNLSNIGTYAFANDANLETVTFAESNNVFSIEEGAFQETGIKTLNFPKTVTSISKNAFYGCKSLTEVTFSEGLTMIGYGAFRDCINLTGKITIPSTVKSIDGYYSREEGAFENTSITEVEILNGNAGIDIGSHTFYDCRCLTKVTLSSRVTDIGTYAFAGNTNLVTVTMDSGNYDQTIGESAFQETGIIELNIPSKVTSIGVNAFYGCKSLVSLTLNEGLVTIGYGAFRDCTKLTGELVIPSTVQKIDGYYSREEGAFENTAITSLVIKDSNYSLSLGSHTFAECIDLRKAELSNRITSIGTYAFAGDTSLVWVKMSTGNYDLSIEEGAFYNTPRLQIITLPKRLKSISQKCFVDSPALTDVYYAGSETEYASISVNKTNNDYYFKAVLHYDSAGPDEMPDTRFTGWKILDGKYYWFENDELQGLEGRGKEIYDPDSDAWYWLDAIQGGAKAVSKDVYQESAAGPYADRPDGTGKWVRYDENGHMVKGFDGDYYFDETYGAMVKGLQVINDQVYYFDPATGVMQKGMRNIDGVEYAFDDKTGIALHQQWYISDGKQYWYENGVRQGYDLNNAEYRGKEIYDPSSDAWYWLDNVQQGAKAVSKDVYQESSGGKWVRYDAKGGMVKGWNVQNGNRYYFDLITGAMYKGGHEINGKYYYFHEDTGILE